MVTGYCVTEKCKEQTDVMKLRRMQLTQSKVQYRALFASLTLFVAVMFHKKMMFIIFMSSITQENCCSRKENCDELERYSKISRLMKALW